MSYRVTITNRTTPIEVPDVQALTDAASKGQQFVTLKDVEGSEWIVNLAHIVYVTGEADPPPDPIPTQV